MAGKTKNFVKTVTALFKEDAEEIPISIFKVPNSLTCSKPEAYVPQKVGLGPLHHLRHELQRAQMYKVAEARRIHNVFQSVDFEELVRFLEQIVAPSVRASYDIYLEVGNDVLACIMAVDGLFLLDQLCRHGSSATEVVNSSLLCHLVNYSGRRLAQETTVQEAMMVENQIPMIVLKVLVIIEWSQNQPPYKIVSELFPKILLGFCRAVSPLNTVHNYPLYKALKHPHVLDLLYYLITLERAPVPNPEEEVEELRLLQQLSEKVFPNQIPPEPRVEAISETICLGVTNGMLLESEQMPGSLSIIADLATMLAPTQFLRPIQLVLGLLKLPFSTLWSTMSIAAKEEEPAKKFLIPSASELHKAGVKFKVANHIRTIMFDPEKAYFYLPTFCLDVTSEVLIRNLVVYEAMIKFETQPFILKWYSQLMSGLIQAAEDVTVLKNQEIISNLDSINEVQVVKMFGEMNNSMELTNTPDLDEEIEKVNKYYNNLWKVRAHKRIKNWQRTASKSWKVLAALLILLLMAIQTFCSVYECPRISFKTHSTSMDFQGLGAPSLRSYM